MVNRIHGDSPNFRPPPEPTFAPGFAQGFIFMTDIADLPDGGIAL
jgi:hypothetical protein